jgi:hypothetical protein
VHAELAAGKRFDGLQVDAGDDIRHRHPAKTSLSTSSIASTPKSSIRPSS